MLRITNFALCRQRYEKFCQSCLVATIFLTILLNGSVSTPYYQISGCLTVTLLLLCQPVKILAPEIKRIVQSASLIVSLVTAWILLQALPLPFDFPTHPIWDELSDAVPIGNGYLSISPIRTLAALPALVLPMLIFISTLTLCQSAHAAKRVWTMLSLLGASIVLLSIILEAFFPEAHFFSKYHVGHGSFSGVFVNRNVSASFFGLTAFALAGTITMAAYSSHSQHTMIAGTPSRFNTVRTTLWFMLSVTLVAIIATHSRAGTMLSLPLLFFCLAVNNAKLHHNRRMSRILIVVGGGMLLLILFGEPVFSRLERSHEDLRLCTWSSTLSAIRNNPWAGTGFATFIEVFPSYRDVTCLGTEGSWHRAHNSYIELTLGLGIPATALLLFFSYRLLFKSYIIGLHRRRSLQAAPIMSLGALGFVSAHSLVDFPLQIPGIAAYCAALLASGSAISLLKLGSNKR